ncbi:hypothetical protein ACFLTQ_02660 [Chloroflexota bacterium]
MTTISLIGVEPKVLEILSGNPALPYSRIAGEVGVTRERVRQIARRNGYPPRHGILKAKVCPVCGDTFHTRNLYCSRNCVYKARQKRIIINCHRCGKTIEKTPGNMRSKSGRYFCDRLCVRKSAVKDHPAAPKKKRNVVGGFSYEVSSTCEIVSAPHAYMP